MLKKKKKKEKYTKVIQAVMVIKSAVEQCLKLRPC